MRKKSTPKHRTMNPSAYVQGLSPLAFSGRKYWRKSSPKEKRMRQRHVASMAKWLR
jgi:hypothetical protein